MASPTLNEDARLQLELWRRLIGITTDTRVDSDFTKKCLEYASLARPGCGPLERKVQELEDFVVAESRPESLEPLILGLGREVKWRIATLTTSDSSCPELYRIKLQETYLMLHPLCKRLQRFPMFSTCQLPAAVCLWLDNVETFAQASTKSLYDAFDIMRDIILSFAAEVHPERFFNRPNAVFSISWPTIETVTALCNTIIQVVLQMYDKDQAYVERQRLLRLKRCLNGIEDKARSNHLPNYYLPVKCRDLLEDIRNMSRAREASMMLRRRLPYDITEIIRLEIIKHPRLRKDSLTYIYNQRAQLSHLKGCCSLPRAVKGVSGLTVIEAKDMGLSKLTCLDHSEEMCWNTERREFDHGHWHVSHDLSALILCTCKHLWTECPGHFEDNSWLLHPAGDEHWRIPWSARNPNRQLVGGPCLFESCTQSFIRAY